MEEGQEILDKRYKVIKKLGGGAFGELYKVEKRKTGDFLAAKVEKAVKNAKHIMFISCEERLRYLIYTSLETRKLKMEKCTTSWLWIYLESLLKICSRSAVGSLI